MSNFNIGIPNLPRDDFLQQNPSTKKMDMHPNWRGYFDQLTTYLQQNISTEGFKPPQQTSDTIAKLDNDKSKSAFIYDSTNNVMKVNINGTFKTITTS